MKRSRLWMSVVAALVSLVGVQGANGACNAEANSGQSDARYVVKDDVVHDQVTKLTWMRCSEGQRWSADAGCQGVLRTFNCEQGNVARSQGWRVPSVDELETLVAKGCRNPAVDETVFPGTPAGPYWTSSKVESNCWRVDFEYGGAYLSNWWDAYYIRLVRSSQ